MGDKPGALLTDLYQLTMLQGYFVQRMNETAVFELFIRRLPRERQFLLAAGLEQALEYIENLRFSREELNWLASSGRFHSDFLAYLADFKFTGDVHAIPEGTVFFQDEPVLRITAPLPEAQFLESRLINLIQFQTMIASKAARCVLAAPNKPLIDFGMRRAHGAEAAMFAARAAYVAGFAGTATVAAGQEFDIPLSGTMAHSFIQAHDDELTAFEHFAESNPSNVVLLIDTYDTEAAAHKVVQLAQRLATKQIKVKGVRLDSGDLVQHARNVRAILDAGGLRDVSIFASGNIDEFKLIELTAAEAQIDAYGVGTRLDVSADAPYLECVYKLQEYAGRARRKHSEGKATWPGRKQVFRHFKNGEMTGDLVTLESDEQEGTPLLEPVMANGRRLKPPTPMATIRETAARNLATLPGPMRKLEQSASYSVQISAAIRELVESMNPQALLGVSPSR